MQPVESRVEICRDLQTLGKRLTLQHRFKKTAANSKQRMLLYHSMVLDKDYWCLHKPALQEQRKTLHIQKEEGKTRTLYLSDLDTLKTGHLCSIRTLYQDTSFQSGHIIRRPLKAGHLFPIRTLYQDTSFQSGHLIRTPLQQATTHLWRGRKFINKTSHKEC